MSNRSLTAVLQYFRTYGRDDLVDQSQRGIPVVARRHDLLIKAAIASGQMEYGQAHVGPIPGDLGVVIDDVGERTLD